MSFTNLELKILDKVNAGYRGGQDRFSVHHNAFVILRGLVKKIEQEMGWYSWLITPFKTRMNEVASEYASRYLPSSLLNFHGYLKLFVLSRKVRGILME